MTFQSNDGLLRMALYANGVSTVVTSLGFLLFPGVVSGLLFAEEFVFLGMSATTLVFMTGAFLAAFTGLVALAVRHTPVHRELAIGVTVLDIGWVLSTIIVLEFAWSVFTAFGLFFAIAIGLAVASFATGQTLGLMAMKRAVA